MVTCRSLTVPPPMLEVDPNVRCKRMLIIRISHSVRTQGFIRDVRYSVHKLAAWSPRMLEKTTEAAIVHHVVSLRQGQVRAPSQLPKRPQQHTNSRAKRRPDTGFRTNNHDPAQPKSTRDSTRPPSQSGSSSVTLCPTAARFRVGAGMHR